MLPQPYQILKLLFAHRISLTWRKNLSNQKNIFDHGKFVRGAGVEGVDSYSERLTFCRVERRFFLIHCSKFRFPFCIRLRVKKNYDEISTLEIVFVYQIFWENYLPEGPAILRVVEV